MLRPVESGGGHAPRAGLFASARGLAATGVAIASNRLALLGIELSEEGSRLLSLLLYGGVALFSLSAGTVFLAAFVTVALWDSNRLLALGMFAALFLGTGVVSLFVARGLVRSGSQLFTASLAELKRDQTSLTEQ